MRSKELINEGPLDFAGKVTAGVRGAFDKTQTAAGAWNVKAQQQETLARAKRDFASWNKSEADLIARGIQPAQLGPYFDKWIAKFYPAAKAGGAVKPLSGPYSQGAALQHIQQAIAANLTTEFDPDEPAAPAKPAEDPAAGSAAMGAMANQLGASTPAAAPANTMANAPVSATNTAKPGNPNAAGAAPAAPGGAASAAPGGAAPAAPGGAAPAADPAHAVFKNPTAFKAEWDKFIASNPTYKLIADPALLSALKTMWMRTGGTKLESKKNKGTRV